jgi:hypothetical protein
LEASRHHLGFRSGHFIETGLSSLLAKPQSQRRNLVGREPVDFRRDVLPKAQRDLSNPTVSINTTTPNKLLARLGIS